jgi:ParB-like chromosome segregation protein Spo0J
MQIREIDINAVKLSGQFRGLYRTEAPLDDLIELLKGSKRQPVITVSKTYTLICGLRRLRSCKRMEKKRIWAEVLDTDDPHEILLLMLGENVGRLDYTPGQKVALGLKLEELENAKRDDGETWKMRHKRANGEGYHGLADFVASRLGWSRATYTHAKAIIEASETHADLVQEMNDSGNVDAPYRTLKERLAPPAPNGEEPKERKQRSDKGQKKGSKKAKETKGDAHEGQPDKPTMTQAEVDRYDAVGNKLPRHLWDTFSGNVEAIDHWIATVRKLGRDIMAMQPWNPWCLVFQAEAAVEQLVGILKASIPYTICPQCQGAAPEGCHCRQVGWLPEFRHQELQMQENKQ